MDGSPWTFNNHFLVFHKLTSREDPKSVSLYYVDFWVQTHDLSIGLMSDDMVKQFGAFLGTFLTYNVTSIRRGTGGYMRIQVRIDIRGLLKRRKKLVLSNKQLVYARFQFERLIIFCFLCG